MAVTDLQKRTLHQLLDKYESRKDYGKPEKSKRRTMLHVNKKNYPGYFHVSDSTFRRRFNGEMKELERRGWVELEWEKFERGSTLKKIILNTGNLTSIYEELGREPKVERYKRLEKLAAKWQKCTPSRLESFYQDFLARVAALQSFPAGLASFSAPADFEDLFRGLDALFRLEQEVSKRRFSVKVFGNSKRWEGLEKAALWVLKNYCLEKSEQQLQDHEILAEKGLLDNPRHINLSGPLVFSTPRGTVDLQLFYPDLGLPPKMIWDLEISHLPAGAVITVENLTSYYHYIEEGPPGHLVIYLGGYHNASSREILKKLYDYANRHNLDIPFYHWGDIDLGGFQIWHHLCKQTGIPVHPLMMDEETFLAYHDHGHPFSPGYGNKLAELLKLKDYEHFHRVIRLMLETGKCLEQEAVEKLTLQ